MKKKRKLKVQTIFNFISIIILISLFTYYMSRFIYYMLDSKKEVTYSELLSKRIIEENETFATNKYLNEIDGVHYFTNNTNNNYVKYKGFLWRIVKINEDNTMTLIMEDSITNMSYDTIYNWLNKSNIKLSGIFETMLNGTKELTNTKTCSDIYDNEKEITCNETVDYKIALLSINDYINTGGNEGFVNNGTEFWISNEYVDKNNIYITSDGEISTHAANFKHGIRPTITLNSDIKWIKGNGTADDPYYIEQENFKTLKEVYPGSYIKFNDSLWKVVSKAGSKVKVVSTECIKDDNNNCKKMIFAENSNEINSNEDNLIKYLNTTYYDSIKDKKYITKGPFYIGNYSLTENNYTSCFEKTTTLKIGLLSVAEPYIYEIPDTFLLTTNQDNVLSIYTINEDKILYENAINSELSVRPSLYLVGTLKITNGEGTYINPYILGE